MNTRSASCASGARKRSVEAMIANLTPGAKLTGNGVSSVKAVSIWKCLKVYAVVKTDVT